MSVAQFIQVVVGGLPYSVAVSDIEKFPGSFFACMIKEEWMKKDEKPTTIDRDGALFKYVNSFLVTGHLPRNKRGKLALDEETLAGLIEEADFYGLDALSDECMIAHRKNQSDLEGFLTIKKYIDKGSYNNGANYGDDDSWAVDYSSELVRSLKEVWAPFCLSGKLPVVWGSCTLFPNSTLESLKIDELISGSKESQPNMRKIKLDSCGPRLISNSIQDAYFVPYPVVQLRLRELQIHQAGYEGQSASPAVRKKSHIGTLVVILNSDYTGGELEVSHGGRTEVVTGAYSWVAMYGDCLHKINPVTSGTRVSLIYDILSTDVWKGLEEDWELEAFPPEHNIFWKFQRTEYERKRKFTTSYKQMDASLCAKIRDGVGTVLQSNDSVIITLQHLYPECQTSPAFLKGGDRALYDLLSEQYDVSVVAVNISNYYNSEEAKEDRPECSIFTPAAIKLALESNHPSIDNEWYYGEGPPIARPKAVSARIQLVVAGPFDRAGLLQSEHTNKTDGYETEYNMYIVSGLQLRFRAVVSSTL